MSLQSTLKALADPIRRDILNLLKEGRLSAGEIGAHFPVTAASISRHLAVLKEADLTATHARENIFTTNSTLPCLRKSCSGWQI